MNTLYVRKNRLIRMLQGIFLPVAIQTFLMLLYALIDSGLGMKDGIGDFFKMMFLLLAYGYVVAGIQSILCALTMEFLINPRIKNHIAVVLISGFLGLLSGFSVIAFVFGKATGDASEWLLLSAVTGLIMGVILRRSYYRAVLNQVSS
ncbi:hypothetical protein [Marinicella sp. W31]|uniref:hypothetical protein n=1 Tax=Marinicella sp. W31 TaxID=3023713 RepID=UPI0037570A7E